MPAIGKGCLRSWPLWVSLIVLTACQTPPERDAPPSPTSSNQGAVSGNVLDAPAAQRYQPAPQERYEQPTPDPDNLLHRSIRLHCLLMHYRRSSCECA